MRCKYVMHSCYCNCSLLFYEGEMYFRIFFPIALDISPGEYGSVVVCSARTP